jgi:hypothetical protein
MMTLSWLLRLLLIERAEAPTVVVWDVDMGLGWWLVLVGWQTMMDGTRLIGKAMPTHTDSNSSKRYRERCQARGCRVSRVGTKICQVGNVGNKGERGVETAHFTLS